MLSDGEVPLFLDFSQNPVDTELWKSVAKFRLNLEAVICLDRLHVLTGRAKEQLFARQYSLAILLLICIGLCTCTCWFVCFISVCVMVFYMEELYMETNTLKTENLGIFTLALYLFCLFN